MGKITFEQIEDELDMEIFLSRQSVPYRRTRGASGIQLNIKTCPFCGDDRWRTYFGTETGSGNCFVCNTGFRKAKFAHGMLGNDGEPNGWRGTFIELEQTLEEQGWSRPIAKPEVAHDYGAVELPRSIPLPLPDGSTLRYLVDRGFGPETAKYFHLSYCQFGWWKYLENGEMRLQPFDGRVIIPVFDLDATLVTFQGRDITGTSDRKYLFPKELPGTGRFLFNAQNVLFERHVVMAEGVFDAAAIKNAVDADPHFEPVVPIASFGKHLSAGSPDGNDQMTRLVKLRQRGVRVVTIMWDGERKALESALTAARKIAGIGLEARVAFLPADKDPNEVPGDVVRRAIIDAKPWSPTMDVMLRLKNPY